MLSVLFALPGAAQNPCAIGEASTCSQTQTGYQRVFERLQIRDHKTLELAQAPVGQFPVHIFKDGIELSAGSGYILAGRTVSLTGSELSESDVFQAAYYIESTQPNRAVAKKAQRQDDGATKRVLETYLTRSLNTELSSNDARKGNEADLAPSYPLREKVASSLQSSEDANLQPSSPVDSSEPASIRMLESVLASRSRSVGRGEARRKKKHLPSTSLDGPEGLGDVLTSSPYEYITFQKASDGNSQKRGIVAHPVREAEPASFRMLRQLQQSR